MTPASDSAYYESMMPTDIPAALEAALDFHDRLLAYYTPPAVFGQTVAYLCRKSTHLSFRDAERLLGETLAARALFPKP